MDQKILVEAVSSHLDSLEKILQFGIIAALAIGWAGVQRQNEIETLGFKFSRRYAFAAISALFLVANVAVLVLLLRLGDLLLLLDKPTLLEGLTRLSTHPWVLNPFAYFGGSSVARFHSAEGFGLLIVVWWVANASLSTLLENKRSRKAQGLLGLFLMVGLGSLLAIYRVYGIVLARTEDLNLSLHHHLRDTALERTIGVVLGILVGALAFSSTLRLQEILFRSRPHNQEPGE